MAAVVFVMVFCARVRAMVENTMEGREKIKKALAASAFHFGKPKARVGEWLRKSLREF